MTAFEGPNFQNLESQDVRTYWEHEAHEFIPWLASEIQSEDPSHLEDVLEIDLEVIEVEKRVGKYSVDILAHVESDGRTVVIENQLGASDHDHLGKAIAYAAGVDADIIVWIAPRFNTEHGDAIQWLNDNSREGIDLFAIRLEVWTIGDSKPAVRFNPVKQPSEWKERARRTENELSDREERREAFWTAFRDRIEEEQTPLQVRKPSSRLFYSNPIGKAGFHLSFVFNTTEDERYITLIIESDEDAYRQLKAEREQIEDEIGAPLDWIDPEETRGGNMRSQIQLRTDGSLDDQDTWDDHLDWFMTYGERFHDVFYDRLQRL